jgi:phosphatidylserine decarboxylase
VEEKYRKAVASDIQVAFYRLLPLNMISRAWGFINSVYLPPSIRVAVIRWYARTFLCCVDEAEEPDMTKYENLGQFFRRKLKDGVRPIDETAAVVSPADGIVVHFGKVDDERVEQVKGVNYSLRTFLGPNCWSDGCASSDLSNQEKYHHDLMIKNEATSLYHCVIYLAPGDYHRFHSPADWSVKFRRHFSGKLLSIRPTFMAWIEDLFTINERVAYVGNWTHGFFSMTAVGATNVGSIKVNFDDDLKTNCMFKTHGSFCDKQLEEIKAQKGGEFGEFNLGSTIVLIFEAPEGLECTVAAGDRIKYGQALYSQAAATSRSPDEQKKG